VVRSDACVSYTVRTVHNFAYQLVRRYNNNKGDNYCSQVDGLPSTVLLAICCDSFCRRGYSTPAVFCHWSFRRK